MFRGFEDLFDFVFEGKVKSLSWEISDIIGYVFFLEWKKFFSFVGTDCVVNDIFVWFI